MSRENQQLFGAIHEVLETIKQHLRIVMLKQYSTGGGGLISVFIRLAGIKQIENQLDFMTEKNQKSEDLKCFHGTSLGCALKIMTGLIFIFDP